jgi:hypothetical protein
LGDASGDTLTLNGSTVSTPNGLNFDSNTLVIDATNDRIGVGTASPGYRLTVAGTSGAATVSLLETGVRSWGIRAGGVATNTFDIADFSAGAARLTIDSAGNVGIGTSSPIARLTIATGSSPSSSNIPLLVRGGSAGVGGDGGGIAFATSSSSAITSASQAASAIRSLNQYGSESNGEEGSLAFYTNRRTGSNTYTGLTEQMRIDASGNIGIGTSSPSQKLAVDSPLDGSVSIATFRNSTKSTNFSINGVGATNEYLVGAVSGDTALRTEAGNLAIGVGDNTKSIVFGSGTTERMRITSSGSLLVGNTGLLSGMFGSFVVGNDRQVSIEGNSGGAIYMRGSAGGWAIGQYYVGSSGTFRGGFGALGGADALTYYWVGTAFNGTGVSLNYGATSWAALSDEREKNIHGVIEKALDKVSQFNGIYYNYKSDEEGAKQRVGFSAQKVKAVFPEAVEEIQREVDNPSEETKRLTLSATDIVPLLVQAIQEQQALINDLTTRLTALENK